MFSGSRVGWLNEIAVQTTLLGAMKLQVTVGGKEGINKSDRFVCVAVVFLSLLSFSKFHFKSPHARCFSANYKSSAPCKFGNRNVSAMVHSTM